MEGVIIWGYRIWIKATCFRVLGGEYFTRKKVIRNGYHISRGGDYTHGGEDVYSIITGLVMVVNGDELWK